MRDGLAAGAAGAALSGLPSTAITLARREELLASTRAVGRVFIPEAGDEDFSLVVAGGVAHVMISLGWGVVLAALLRPVRGGLFAGAVAGLGIAVVDLGIIGRRLPSIRALDPVPQVLDHLAYGVVVGAVLSRRRRAGRARVRGGAGSRS